MNTLDLDTLAKFTEKARELQAIAAELKPFLEMIRELGGRTILPAPADRLIRAGEAAQLLGVSQTTIGHFVRDGLLKPYYVNSEQRRFKLSEVNALIKDTPTACNAAGDGSIKSKRGDKPPRDVVVSLRQNVKSKTQSRRSTLFIGGTS